MTLASFKGHLLKKWAALQDAGATCRAIAKSPPVRMVSMMYKIRARPCL